MSQKPWSLARRLTVGVSLTTLMLVGSVSGVSAGFIYAGLNREHEEISVKALDVIRAQALNRSFHAEDFSLWVSEVAQEATIPLGWRVYPDGLKSESVDFGQKKLLSRVELDPSILGTSIHHDGRLLERTEILMVGEGSIDANTQPLVCLVSDASSKFAIFRIFLLVAAIVILVGTTAAMILGTVFGNRLSGQLRVVSDRARRVSQGNEELTTLGSSEAPIEIQEIADSLMHTLQTIRQESERSRTLIAGLAHELRHPIQNMIGEVDVLLMQGNHSSETRDALHRQAEEVKDLARSIDNLVTLCAHMGGSWNETREVVDLGEELEIRPSLSRKRSHQRGVEVRIHTEGDLSVRGDREALCLVIQNLVSNALSWSPEKGTVDISLIGAEDHIEFIVDDEGPGVPVTEREAIFEPFNTGRSPDGHRQGFGLGLTLSRNVVIRHGGLIEVIESPLGGARFRAVIPRNALNQAKSA